jgi:hypothetical protein
LVRIRIIGEDGGDAVWIALVLAVVLAFPIGSASQRARDAHSRWVSYRSRVIKNLEMEVAETVRTIAWAVALLGFRYLVIRL